MTRFLSFAKHDLPGTVTPIAWCTFITSQISLIADSLKATKMAAQVKKSVYHGLLAAVLIALNVIPFADADLLDNAIKRDMERLNIRGASVLFYDEVSMRVFRRIARTALVAINF